MHSFEETPPISTHLFGLFCGRLRCFIDSDFEKIPIRLFISHNKSDLLDAKEIFRIIQIGLIYFEE